MLVKSKKNADHIADFLGPKFLNIILVTFLKLCLEKWKTNQEFQIITSI